MQEQALRDGAFQSTPSAWRETVSFPPSLGVDSYFNPLPPHGGRLFDLESDAILGDFNPLPPHGGRLIIDILKAERLTISIHSLRMEGDHFSGCAVCIDCISIHSLRMEGDYQLRGDQHVYFISIHSLRMEGDPILHFIAPLSYQFLSTPSAWRETLPRAMRSQVSIFQSTPSAWRETPDRS